GGRCLSPRTGEATPLSVPFAGPAGELADAFLQPGRIDHLGVRPQTQQEALEPFEPAGGELDLEAAVPEFHLARGLVVLGDPSGLGPEADGHANVVLGGRVQGPAPAPAGPRAHTPPRGPPRRGSGPHGTGARSSSGGPTRPRTSSRSRRRPPRGRSRARWSRPPTPRSTRCAGAPAPWQRGGARRAYPASVRLPPSPPARADPRASRGRRRPPPRGA